MTASHALILVLLAVAAPARAEEVDAKEQYRRATAHFNLGRFKEAAAEYEKVFEGHPDPVILYNIAQSYRLAGDQDEKALFFYKSYLQRMPKAPNRAEVLERIAALEKSVEEHRKNMQQPPNSTLDSEHRTGESKTAEPAAATTTSAPAPEKTPVYKKWWLWTIVGVAVVGVGLGVGLGLGLSSPESFRSNLPEGGPGSMGLTFR